MLSNDIRESSTMRAITRLASRARWAATQSACPFIEQVFIGANVRDRRDGLRRAVLHDQKVGWTEIGDVVPFAVGHDSVELYERYAQAEDRIGIGLSLLSCRAHGQQQDRENASEQSTPHTLPLLYCEGSSIDPATN